MRDFLPVAAAATKKQKEPTFIFAHWKTKVADFTFNAAIPLYSVLVPTLDSVRYTYILERAIHASAGGSQPGDKAHSALLCGGSGVGKSVVAAATLRALSNGWQSSELIFSARTGATKTQAAIEGRLEQRRN